jgi:hypothetical protein
MEGVTVDGEGPVVTVDVRSLGRSKLGSITCGIWFEAGGAPFPSEGWNDFVVVILGWWSAELRALPARGNPRATVRLEFMDGPYEVEISAPRAMEGPWLARFVQRGDRRRVVREVRLSGQALIVSVHQAARSVLAECDARGWNSRDVEGLRRGIDAATLIVDAADE